MTNDLSPEDWDLYEQQFNGRDPWRELVRVVGSGGVTISSPPVPNVPLPRREVPTNRLPPLPEPDGEERPRRPFTRAEKGYLAALALVSLAGWLFVALSVYGIVELIEQVTR